MSLGQLLREARERRGVSLDDAERATRIRKRYLAALEGEDFAKLPPAVYVRGLLRNYAQYLGVDPEVALARLTLPAESVPANRPLRLPRASSWGFLNWIPVVVLLVAIGLLGAYLYGPGGDAPISGVTPEGKVALALPMPTLDLPPTATTTPSATATHTHTVVPSPSATPTRAVPVEVTLRAVAQSWVQSSVDGMADFAGMLKPGDEHTWRGSERVSMRLGYAPGLEVTFNGQQQGSLGRYGGVVDIEWTAAGARVVPPAPAPAAVRTVPPRANATPTPPPTSPTPAPPNATPAGPARPAPPIATSTGAPAAAPPRVETPPPAPAPTETPAEATAVPAALPAALPTGEPAATPPAGAPPPPAPTAGG